MTEHVASAQAWCKDRVMVLSKVCSECLQSGAWISRTRQQTGQALQAAGLQCAAQHQQPKDDEQSSAQTYVHHTLRLVIWRRAWIGHDSGHGLRLRRFRGCSHCAGSRACDDVRSGSDHIEVVSSAKGTHENQLLAPEIAANGPGVSCWSSRRIDPSTSNTFGPATVRSSSMRTISASSC